MKQRQKHLMKEVGFKMKKFNQLTRPEQFKAIDRALTELVDCAANGLITFGEKLQRRIDLAIKLAEERNMPWGRQEHILEVAKPELFVMAKGIAEDAFYKENGEFIKEEIVKL